MARIKIHTVSPAVKIAAAVAVVLILGVSVFFGFKMYKDLTEPSAADSALTSGESFEPGAHEQQFGTDTEGILDGLTQKVKAVAPSQEWKDAYPDAVCGADANGVEECIASAASKLPGSALGGGGENGEDGGGLLDGLTSPAGGIGSILGMGLLVLVGYYLIFDED